MRIRVGSIGIRPLDVAIGPLNSGQSLLLVNDPGVPVEPVLYQAAFHHLAHEREVVYVTFSRSPEAVRAGMREHGFDPTHHDQDLVFVDGYSALVGLVSTHDTQLRDPLSFRELTLVLDRMAQEHPGAVLVLDPLSHIVDYLTVEHFARQATAIRQTFARFRLTIGAFTAWPYPEGTEGVRGAFDAVLECKAAEDRVIFGQYFQLERSPNYRARPLPPYPYRVEKPGGVVIYVPKIVITGPMHAGKTTFVHTLSDWARSSEFQKSTVALDFGHVRVDGLSTDLFGTPGQIQFDPIIQKIADQAYGIVVVVDSADPDSFQRAREMLHRTAGAGLPTVIAANKQDLPNAVAPESIGVYVRN